MKTFMHVKVLVVIMGFALLASPAWAESDDVAGRLVTGAPGPSPYPATWALR